MILTLLVFFLILNILVFVHEFGHFWVAKKAGILIEEFGFGFPPRLWAKKIGETVYSINWLPVGGFVKLYGENGEDGKKAVWMPPRGVSLSGAISQTRSFSARSKKIRAAILIAGVAMNFALAVVITGVLLSYGVMEPSGRVKIERVVSGAPAAIAGLKEEDVIRQITIKSKQATEKRIDITKSTDLIDATKMYAGEELVFTILRQDKLLEILITPRKEPPAGEGPMGVAITDLELRRYTIAEVPMQAVKINLVRTGDMLMSLGTLFWRLLTFQPLRAEIAGPIGIAHVTGEAVKFGWKAVLEFASILSLNLAVLNILPIPALDGGRLMFVFLEKLLGRRVKPAFEQSAHQAGMVILFFLILLASISDILRLTRG